MMAHPFYLRAAAFLAGSREGKPYSAWKNTVLVRGGETLHIHIYCKDFPCIPQTEHTSQSGLEVTPFERF